MIIFFALERKLGEKFLKGNKNSLPAVTNDTVKVYLNKASAIKALQADLKISKQNCDINFLLFEYDVENVQGFEITEDISAMSGVTCKNEFPLANLLTVESLFFYCDKGNRIRYKRKKNYVDPVALEKLREETEQIY